MSQVITPVKVDNVTLEKNASQEIQAKAGVLMKYSDARFKVISFTRAMDAASGNVSYTGVGFSPKAAIFIAVDPNFSLGLGVDDGLGSGQGCVFLQATTEFSMGGNSIIMYENSGGGIYQAGAINSFDADGFTVTWAKGGLPSAAIATIKCLVLR